MYIILTEIFSGRAKFVIGIAGRQTSKIWKGPDQSQGSRAQDPWIRRFPKIDISDFYEYIGFGFF